MRLAIGLTGERLAGTLEAGGAVEAGCTLGSGYSSPLRAGLMRHSHNAGRIAGAEFRHLPHAVRMVSRVQHIARCTLLRTVAQQRPCLPVMSSSRKCRLQL